MATVTITKPEAAHTTAVKLVSTEPAWKPAPGTLGNLTDAQKNALKELKEQIQKEGWFVEDRMNDAMLLRFLRARKFNVANTKKMLKEAEEWRKEFGVDELMKTFTFDEQEAVDKLYPQYYHKMDKAGQPVYIERLNNLDMKALYAVTSQERVVKRLVYEYERFLSVRAPACARECGHPVETSCTILDLGGVSLTNFVAVKDYVMEASSIGQNRYPECMGKFYIINAPWAFGAIWRCIRPWLDEVTISKVDIVGSDYSKKLLKQIAAENLPKEFGGECDCEGGCSLSDSGPWKYVPQSAPPTPKVESPPSPKV
ncbi:hypothetical protein CYLTODRAFT_352156 [Cylindrobasidium torrendii FP15055 ss-10]|uniref:CRAL-TRIO domain-containing protein n=1 Tax=Cylindrobasidium torrendii FP15055 ss-10 TaxID=1314674 RepID=A0A0D7BBT9_9AGAR|nr:hypothetical protein CYLTODRAFT_352156 [Cylindrobasidium torrendii FP15055 ss-10]